MSIIVFLGLFVITITGLAKLAPMDVLSCLAPLIISLYPENQFMLILTESRFHRRFRGRAIWSLFRSGMVLISGLAGVFAYGAAGLAWGFLAGNAISYVILRSFHRDWLQAPYNTEMARVLKTVWFQMTIAGVMIVSGPYLSRVILSAIHSYTDTADLVVATSVMYLFSVPVTCLGGLLASMISKYTSVRQFSIRGRILYFLMITVGVTVIPAAFILLGPFIARLMFPKFGENPVHLFGILVWAVPAQTLISFTPPVVVKFAPIRLVPIINVISLAATLLPAILLIPHYATKGAAWAIVAGRIITATLWVLAALLYVLKENVNAHLTMAEEVGK